MAISQVESGKAWEYGLAREFADILKAVLAVNKARNQAQGAYDILPAKDRSRISSAANEAVVFLRAHDDRLLHTDFVEMQSDQKGIDGDVRDIVLHTQSGEVGVSAKHRHNALKHPRLSDKIDFGNLWYENPCSEIYWNAVNPVFDMLRATELEKFSQLEYKDDIVYVPLLRAFIDEVRANADPARMLRYLVGVYDFYKIIKDNGNVVMQSFNMGGNLKWGHRVPMPTDIIQFALKSGSKNTALLAFNEGWQLSFRIHNARSVIETSLKFDVRLIGNPQLLSRHEIPFS